jgi:predicted metal-dependent peptidase
MALDKTRIAEWSKRMLLSKMRILSSQPFYGLLLSHITFNIDETIETACTDGERIYFSPKFLDELDDDELDFVMMHEILHIALQHCFRYNERDPELFNIACDIVVNSNILLSADMDEDSITLSKYGVSMHTAPDGKEGFHYTAEQVYEMLPSMPDKPKRGGRNSASGFWDDHETWQDQPDDDYESEQWDHLLQTACEVISIREPSQSYGGGPLMAQRLMRLGRKSEIDWRTVLQEFLQEEINDYSFSPPDRRFADSDFFLPDYNEKEEVPGKVWFLIDTSGSISDQAINAAYGEICSAIEQFGGKLEGLLSFTESYVTEPISFHSITELMDIKPIGGGGNDFSDIFRYMRNHMAEDLPGYIVIITDGYDRFPPESDAMGVPVLWLINNENATPPWGKVARITV